MSNNIVMCGWEWGTIREATQWTYTVGETSIVSTHARSGKYSCHVNIYDHVTFALPYSGHLGIKDIYVQFACYFDGTQGLNGNFFSWLGEQGKMQMGVCKVGPNGQVLVYTGQPTNVTTITWPSCAEKLRVASKTRIITNTWYVFELYIRTDFTDGVVMLKIDGNLEGSYYGDTSNSNPPGGTDDMYFMSDTIDFYYFNGMWIDDIIVDEEDWPGCQKVILLRPNANGDYVEWSKTNDYDNYEHVNEVPVDTTDYVYTTEVNKLDLYHVESLPVDAYEIVALRSDAWALKNSAATSENSFLQFALQAGVTSFFLATSALQINVQLAWGLTSAVWPLENPVTHYNWTVDDVNRVQAGFLSIGV